MPTLDLPKASALTAELLGIWQRPKDGDVFVVGVSAQMGSHPALIPPETHEFRAVFYAETLEEARLQLLTWKFFAQKHKIEMFLPVRSVALARHGTASYVREIQREDVAAWVFENGRWKGRERQWCLQRTSAYWSAP